MPLTQETKVQSALDDVASNFPRSARPCRAAGFDATYECDPEETGETALETTQRIIERGEACEFMPMRCALTGGVAGQVGLALCTERFFSIIHQTNELRLSTTTSRRCFRDNYWYSPLAPSATTA